MYKIGGTSRIPEGKSATFGYGVYEANSLKKIARYANTHATVPAVLTGGHRLRNNVTEILPWMRIDADEKGEEQGIDAALTSHGLRYIKKPSTRNDQYGWKWHYLIPVANVSQNYDEYKLQYDAFLKYLDLTLKDTAVKSVVQNMNPYGKRSNKTVVVSTGKIWSCPAVTLPERKQYDDKKSDVLKKDVRQLLKQLDPNMPYDEWLKVGMALYDWNPKKGFKLWDKWSQGGNSYDGTTIDKWENFSRGGYVGKPVTLGTLYYMVNGSPGDTLEGEELAGQGVVPGSKEDDVDELVWDGIIGRFVEMRGDKLRYHPQGNFKQTLRSRHGWALKDVNEHLGTIPAKEVVYRPGGEAADDELNVWRGVNGWSEGKYDLIMKILDNLFIGQEEARDRFIEWMAYIVQTQNRTGVAWGFFGAAGSGKGFVAELMRNLVGQHNSRMNIGDDLLQSQFNEYAYRVQFLHLNEIASDFHGRHGVAGKLKSLVADPYLSINIKNMSIFDVENFANVILNSNKANPIELDMDDRRWNMVVSEKSLRSRSWWYEGMYEDALGQWEAFGYMLRNLEVNETRVRVPMENSAAKQKVIEQTVPQVVQLAKFINECDGDGLMNFLEMDPNDLSTIELAEDVENAVLLRFWSGALLTELYQYTTDNPEATAKLMALRLKTPYLKGSYGEFRIRGSKLRGLKITSETLA